MAESPTKDPRRIRDMFDRIAGRYDLLNRLLSLGLDQFWRRRMLKFAGAGERLLDLACGSGDVLWEADETFEHRVGADFSFSMLSEAQSKQNGNLTDSGVRWIQADALRLPFASSNFDVVTCAFGVRNFDARVQIFREVNRTLKESGRFLILEFFPPESNWYNWPMRMYLQGIVPLLGSLVSPSGGAYDYLSRSIESFVSDATLQNELSRAGFANCETKSIFFGLVQVVMADLKGDDRSC